MPEQKAALLGLGIFLLLIGIPLLFVGTAGPVSLAKNDELTSGHLYTGCGLFLIGAACLAVGVTCVAAAVGG